MNNKRNSTVELLRILSMFFIVWYHYCGRAWGLFGDLSALESGGGKIVMHAFGQLGVPVFLFISGYYGIHFRCDRLRDILVQCVLYTFVFYAATAFFVPEIRSIRMAILQIFGMTQLWFIFNYVILYVFSDGINHVLDGLTFKQYTLVVVLFLYILIGLWISKANALNIMVMIQYYVIARYVHKYMSSVWKRRMKWFVVPVLCVFLFPLLIGLYTHHIDAVQPYVYKYFNPLLMLVSMVLVVAADEKRSHSNVINFLASSMLAVYMIHESAYLPALVNSYFDFEKGNYVRIFIVILIIMLGAVAIDKVRIGITNKIIRLYSSKAK